MRSVPRLREKEAEQSQPGSAESLKGARDLCRSLDLMKKQCVVGSTQLQNRCLLRQRILHLPAAYPRIDLASLIQTDPNVFGSQGGCLWYTTNDIVDKF